MTGTVATSVISFVSTNIDNIFVMMLFYAQVDEKLKKKHIVIGQYLGLAVLVLISILGAFGLNFVPQEYIGFLGLLPIALGVREWINYKIKKRLPAAQCHGIDRKAETINEEQIKNISLSPGKEYSRLQYVLIKAKCAIFHAVNPEIFSVVVVAVSNGADNIGVYIPLFTGYSIMQIVVTMTVFFLMMALWCLLGSTITDFPRITAAIQKHKHVAVPIIFIGLGVYIFIKSGLIGTI